MRYSFDHVDYFRCYVGCQFRMRLKTGEILTDYISSVLDTGEVFGLDGVDYFPFDEKVDWIRILLRPLDTLTDIEKSTYYSLTKPILGFNFQGERIETRVDTPESLLYLFKYGIDAFDLIKKGIALRV